MSAERDDDLLEWLLGALRDSSDARVMLPGARARALLASRLAGATPGPVLYLSGAVTVLETLGRRDAGAVPTPLVIAGPMEQNEFVLRTSEIASGTTRLIAMGPERLWHARMARALRAGATRLVILETSGLALGTAERGVLLRAVHERLAIVLPDVPVVTITPPAADTYQIEEQGTAPRRVSTPLPPPALLRKIEVADDNERFTVLRDAVKAAAGHALIVAPTRGMATRLAQALGAESLETNAYHAGLSLAERVALLEGFRSGRLRLLVATSAIQLEPDLPCPSLLAFSHLPASLDLLIQVAEIAETATSDVPLVILHGPRDLDVVSAGREPGFPSAVAVRRVLLGLQRRAVRGTVLVEIEPGKGFLRGRGLSVATSLALLNSAGLIVRRSDFSRAITVEELVEHSDGLAPLADVLQLRRGVPVPADPLQLAVQLGWPPHRVHAWLLDAEDRGELRLRTFGREALYSLTSRSREAEERLDALTDAAAREMTASVARLSSWLAARQCRVQALARIIGWDPLPRCGRCDWCMSPGARLG